MFAIRAAIMKHIYNALKSATSGRCLSVFHGKLTYIFNPATAFRIQHHTSASSHFALRLSLFVVMRHLQTGSFEAALDVEALVRL